MFKNECNIHLLSHFPANTDRYAQSYVLVGKDLHYVSSNGMVEKVPIKDFDLFIQNLNGQIRENGNPQIYTHHMDTETFRSTGINPRMEIYLPYTMTLRDPEVQNLISRNGGHYHNFSEVQANTFKYLDMLENFKSLSDDDKKNINAIRNTIKNVIAREDFRPDEGKKLTDDVRVEETYKYLTNITEQVKLMTDLMMQVEGKKNNLLNNDKIPTKERTHLKNDVVELCKAGIALTKETANKGVSAETKLQSNVCQNALKASLNALIKPSEKSFKAVEKAASMPLKWNKTAAWKTFTGVMSKLAVTVMALGTFGFAALLAYEEGDRDLRAAKNAKKFQEKPKSAEFMTFAKRLESLGKSVKATVNKQDEPAPEDAHRNKGPGRSRI